MLDGGMGTMIQRCNLSETDYRGRRFTNWHTDLKGCNDVLNLTRPEIITNIHQQYLEAGAEIITTNTFNANAVSLADYGLEEYVRDINLGAVCVAKEARSSLKRGNSDRLIFIAGSVGPTNKTASMSPDVSDPAYRAVTYKELYQAYRAQIKALLDGGVDIILFETVFDTLNAKAGLEAANTLMCEVKKNLPIMLSLTLSSQGGRTFSGQTLEAFLASVQHTNIISVGLNCSFGATDMLPYLRELAKHAPYYVSAYPNAGLPNALGEYDETPEKMAEHVRPFLEEGLVNVLGGCCGTTPEHIARFALLTKDVKPHLPTAWANSLWLSGLELLEVKPENNFINIGERCNVAGSRKFLWLIKEKKYEEALSIARAQVENGAQILDINMDDGMLDGVQEMTHFLNLIASEPDIARVPMMIDSSNWDVIEEGLMCIQGKSIVNSISLKEGEDVFLRHARRIQQLGAAIVVMAFDEKGQADTFERKIEVCKRAYRLLVEDVHLDKNNIIFDPNVLAIATGIEEHNCYGLDFIRATEWIKHNLPGAKVSGGISNLSFAFRGNNYVREAMHAVFLYHAIRAGLDMGIVNPASTVLYENIEPDFRILLEDVILNRRKEAADELIQWTIGNGQLTMNAPQILIQHEEHRTVPLEERLEQALIKGVSEYLEEDLKEALKKYSRAVDIIDGPLMSGMNKVGELFGAGKMFLPQVVKTARTMKKAVTILQPAIEAENAVSGTVIKAGKVLFATVKGDVHDIGKNIVSIVLACNNYEVIDLGVMVQADEIVRRAIEEKPDLVCLSGLITPSLEEMVHVTDEMQRAGLTIPIMVGGATTSKLHTAVKIAPHYDYPVIHVLDASQNPLIAAKLLDPDTRDAYVQQLNQEYEMLRESFRGKKETLLPLAAARQHPVSIDWSVFHPVKPTQTSVHVLSYIPLEEVIPYIHWTFFFMAWKLNGCFAEIIQLHGCDACRAARLASIPEADRAKVAEAMQLYKDATRLLDDWVGMKAEFCKAVYGFFPANSEADNIWIGDTLFPVLRQQTEREEGVYKSLADYVMPLSEGRTDYIGAFVVTAGGGVNYLKAKFEQEGDTYKVMLLQTLTDRLAEAASEYLHERVRKEYWGYVPDEELSVSDLFKVRYQGIRPAIGYPSLPDQWQNRTLDHLLNMSQIDVSLTENGAMFPAATVSGLYIAHPAARYFMIGKIGKDQVVDYASRRGLSIEETEYLLSKNIF